MRVENTEVRLKQERMRTRGEKNCMEIREVRRRWGEELGNAQEGKGWLKGHPLGHPANSTQ